MSLFLFLTISAAGRLAKLGSATVPVDSSLTAVGDTQRKVSAILSSAGSEVISPTSDRAQVASISSTSEFVPVGLKHIDSEAVSLSDTTTLAAVLVVGGPAEIDPLATDVAVTAYGDHTGNPVVSGVIDIVLERSHVGSTDASVSVAQDITATGTKTVTGSSKVLLESGAGAVQLESGSTLLTEA